MVGCNLGAIDNERVMSYMWKPKCDTCTYCERGMFTLAGAVRWCKCPLSFYIHPAHETLNFSNINLERSALLHSFFPSSCAFMNKSDL